MATEVETDTLGSKLSELKAIINHVITFGPHLTQHDLLKNHSTQTLIIFMTLLSAVSKDNIKDEVQELILKIHDVIRIRRISGQRKKSKD